MAQFDIFRLASGQLVVDLQTDLIGLEVTRIVAPLRPAAHFAALPKITPVVAFEGTDWVVRLQEMAAVMSVELGAPVGSLVLAQDEIKAGIDVLMRGF